MKLRNGSRQWLRVLTKSKNDQQLVASQTLKAMKLTLVLITASFLQVSATGFSQNVTISVKNVTVEKVFREIERQTGIGFLYSKKMLHDADRVSIDVNNAPVSVVLKECFKGQSLDFKMQNNTIIIKKKAIDISGGHVLESYLTTPPPLDVRGKIIDENGDPVEALQFP